MKNIFIGSLITLTALLLSSASHANHYRQNEQTFSAGVNFEKLFLNPEIAERELLGETANAINIDFAFGQGKQHLPHVQFALGGSFIFYDDQGQFTQEVADDFGYISNEVSDISAFHAYVEGGPNIPLGKYSNINLRGGYELPVVSERNIDNCPSCVRENINIDAGFYGQAGFSYSIGQMNFDTQYKYYLNEDNGIDNAFSFGISGRY